MKIGIIGAGAVGSACLTALVQRRVGREIVVVGCGRQMNQSSYSVGGSVQSFWFGDVANHAIVQARCLDYIESTNR